MDDREKLFYSMCVEMLDSEHGISGVAYSAMLSYAEEMKYHETESMLRMNVEATDDCWYLPSGFSRQPV